jgi:hypothetical protein
MCSLCNQSQHVPTLPVKGHGCNFFQENFFLEQRKVILSGSNLSLTFGKTANLMYVHRYLNFLAESQ